MVINLLLSDWRDEYLLEALGRIVFLPFPASAATSFLVWGVLASPSKPAVQSGFAVVVVPDFCPPSCKNLYDDLGLT